MTKGVLGASTNLHAQERLLRYLGSARLHPALLLIGADREEKKKIAKGIAKYIFCNSKIKENYCDLCSSCRRIEKDLFPDVLFYQETEEEKYKVDTVREIVHHMEISPLEGHAKVCIIDEFHQMNAASSNAFLKTLEEPHENRYFILLTSQKDGILPTILSRCMEFQFRPETEATGVTDALRAEYTGLLQSSWKEKTFDGVIEKCDTKEDCLSFLGFLQAELRRAAIDIAPDRGIFAANPPDKIFRRFDAVLETEGRLRSNANSALMLEGLLRSHFLEGP